jgi:hypothetical protein
MNPNFLRRLFSGPRFRSEPEGGFTLVEMIMGVTVLGIIMVPLAMAIAVGFRATLHTQERLEAAQDAQAVSAYFPPDVQSVDSTGFNPTDSVNMDVCPASASDVRVETPLALFVWNQDLGVNGQSVARYIARGTGRDSELVRRYCRTTSDTPVDSVLARNFGSGTTVPAKDYFTDPGAVNPARNETPMCGSRTCTLLIHGTFDYRLEADRRVAGNSSNATIPGAPTNVHTTGGNQRATIYWDTPVDDGGTPILEYYIQNMQTLAITGPYTTPDATPPGAGQPGALGVTITGLTNGQGYTFRVRAKNVLGPGSFSEPSSVVTPGPTVPDPPTVGVATADPTVAGKASLTWSLPPGYNDGGSPNTGYRIYAQNAPTPAVTVDVGAGATSGAITGLLNNTPYTMSVSALNERGESSPSAGSNQILTLPGKPGTPTASSSGTIGTVVLTFTPPSGGAVGTLTNFRAHIVEPNTYTTPTSAATACPSAGTCTLTVSGVTAGQTVKVQAQNATGWGVESDASTGIDVTAPVVTLTAPSAGAILGTGTPTFSGAAGTLSGDLPTVTVRIYSGATATGSPVQTRTATASGSSWTVNGSPALADGQYTAQASQSDAFGNTGVSGTRTFQLDSTGPAISITTPANNSSSTNLTPTFVGTAGTAAGPFPSADGTTITVKVYSGPTATGSPVQTKTTTRSGANWSVAASPALGTGVFTVEASQTDALGNVGTDTHTFGIDTTAPTVAITSPTAAGAVNTSTPTISGTAGDNGAPNTDSPTVTVKIYAGTTATGSAIQTLSATRSGTAWSIATSSLANGQFTAQATQTDAAGNTGTSTAVTFVVDTTTPAVTLTAPSNNSISNNTTPTFSGAAGNAAGPSPSADSATVTVKIYAGSTATGSPVQTRNATRSGTTWTIAASPALADGVYTAQASQTDAAGNTGNSSANTFTIDTVGPTVVVTSPTDNGATNDTTPTITGTAGTAGSPNADSSTISVKIYSGATATGSPVKTLSATRSGASWSTTVPTPVLAVGTYTVQATQTDSIGNTGTSQPNTFGVDTTGPTVTVTSPTANQASNDTDFTFTGTAGNAAGPYPAADAATVTVKVFTGTVATGSPVRTLTATRSGAAWSIDASPVLTAGQYTVQASQIDVAGNTGTSTAVTFVIDVTAPTVTLTAPTANQVFGTATTQIVTFSGAAGNAAGPSPSADSTTVTANVYAGSSATGSPVQSRTATRSPSTSTAWSVASTALSPGTYTVKATQLDAAGNSGSSTAVTFRVVINHVYVATPGDGGTTTGDGTADDPLSTVTLGLAKAVSLGWPQVDVGQGTFNEGATGVALVDNVNISGGWNSDFTAQTGANTSTVIQGGQQAALGDGDTGITLSRLMLSGLGSSATDRNVYGLRAIASSSVTLNNVSVVAATGFDGTDGATGTPGATGDVGDTGVNGTSNTTAGGGNGGPGGSGGAVTAGGAGGRGGDADGSPLAVNGASVSGGGSGGTLGNRGGSSGCQSGSDAGNGNPGTNITTPGAAGAGGSNSLTAAVATFVGSTGGGAGAGGNGTSGGGGGGGGASGAGCSGSARNGGGGGGGGGQGATGGTGGTGGSYGGGSFGVYAHNSNVILDATSSVVTGNGASGGDGGLGGAGATGGNGGAKGLGGTNGGDGGVGGKGGNSANGGRGGGGAGGPSVGLFDIGSGTITRNSATVTPGAGGAGGAGGVAGSTGASQAVYP